MFRARGWSVRARVTLLAGVVLAIAISLASIALVELQHRSLLANVDASAANRIDDMIALVQSGATASSPPSQAAGDGALVQVIDDAGNVILASANIQGEPALTTTPASSGTGSSARTTSDLPIGDGEHPYRVMTRRTFIDGRVLTIVTATSLEVVQSGDRTLTSSLALGAPLLIGATVLLVWLVVGHALHPVESVRVQVADISARDLTQRLEVPPVADEIGRLTTTMNDLLERLQEAADLQRQFVGDASHELKSPLATIITQLEVTLRRRRDEAWPTVAADVLGEARRMQHLVEDLLSLASSESVQPRCVRRLDLDDLVFQEIDRARPMSASTIDGSGVSAGQVDGDEEQLRGVIRNLLDNARRHARTRIQVTLIERGRRVELIIDDDGAGIPRRDRRRIFERFARLDESRARDAGGTGLGLAIVADATRQHRGTVQVSSSPTGGARFVISLPAASQPTSPGS